MRVLLASLLLATAIAWTPVFHVPNRPSSALYGRAAAVRAATKGKVRNDADLGRYFALV